MLACSRSIKTALRSLEEAGWASGPGCWVSGFPAQALTRCTWWPCHPGVQNVDGSRRWWGVPRHIWVSEMCACMWLSPLRNNYLILQRCSHSPKNKLTTSLRTLPGGYLLMGRKARVQNTYYCTEHHNSLDFSVWIRSEYESIRLPLKAAGLMNKDQLWHWPTGVFCWVFIRVKSPCQYSHFSMSPRYLFLPWVSSQASYMALYKWIWRWVSLYLFIDRWLVYWSVLLLITWSALQ